MIRPYSQDTTRFRRPAKDTAWYNKTDLWHIRRCPLLLCMRKNILRPTENMFAQTRQLVLL